MKSLIVASILGLYQKGKTDIRLWSGKSFRDSRWRAGVKKLVKWEQYTVRTVFNMSVPILVEFRNHILLAVYQVKVR